MKCQLKFPERSHIEVTVDSDKVINIPLSRGNVKRTLIPLTNGQSFEISGTESERANDDAVFVHIKRKMEKTIKKLKVVEDDFVSDALRQRFRNSLLDALVKKFPYKTNNFLEPLVVKFETDLFRFHSSNAGNYISAGNKKLLQIDDHATLIKSDAMERRDILRDIRRRLDYIHKAFHVEPLEEIRNRIFKKFPFFNWNGPELQFYTWDDPDKEYGEIVEQDNFLKNDDKRLTLEDLNFIRDQISDPVNYDFVYDNKNNDFVHDYIFKFLVDNSLITDPNIVNRGETALTFATIQSNNRIAKVNYLLSLPNINVNKRNDAGETPLMKASTIGDHNVVRILLQHPKIDTNMINKEGKTALMLAAQSGKYWIVDILLSDPRVIHNMKDKEGKTAFDLASKYPAVKNIFIDKLLTNKLKNKNINFPRDPLSLISKNLRHLEICDKLFKLRKKLAKTKEDDKIREINSQIFNLETNAQILAREMNVPEDVIQSFRGEELKLCELLHLIIKYGDGSYKENILKKFLEYHAKPEQTKEEGQQSNSKKRYIPQYEWKMNVPLHVPSPADYRERYGRYGKDEDINNDSIDDDESSTSKEKRYKVE